MKKHFVLSAICLLMISACQTHQMRKNQTSTAAVKDEAEANLTQSDAENRSAIVSAVKYALEIKLAREQDTFHGKLNADFQLSDTQAPLFIDFRNGATLEKVTLNGQTLATAYSKHRINLPSVELLKGVNQIEVIYTQPFSHDGRGLHHFQDPEDKQDYLYTQFETNDAQQMFPCFDQPDLKAEMTLTVVAPKDWEVITTTRETSVQKGDIDATWNFATTPKLSTYVFSLHAGPYRKWQSQAGNIPLRLFVRKSLAKYVKTDDWFVPTKAGLKFYGEYFDYAYPFKKYDQIIAPDFNAGAMENVGAVTFSERYVNRGEITRETRQGLASVILHEMAHMWFGDLVTMKWWNGLWLNESFATFMSTLSQSKATEFKDSWVSFYRYQHGSARWADQLVTTHPIDSEIPDTNSAFTNFDAITYGKGAASLSQLNYYLGEDVFRDGVRQYFKTHAYGNTTLKDFMGALEKSSRKDLSTWSQSWLRQEGLDSVMADYTCDNGIISKFSLRLEGPNGKASPRTHGTLVSLLKDNGKKLVQQKTASVVYQGHFTDVPELNGEACPAAVNPNQDGHDYINVKLDPRTLATATSKLNSIESEFTRLQIWAVLYQMVRDQEFGPQEYLLLVKNSLAKETSLHVAGVMIDPLTTLLSYLPISTDAEVKMRLDIVGNTEKVLWSRLLSAKPNSDWQKILYEAFVRIAETPTAADHLVSLLTRKITIVGLTLDTDRKWAAIIRLSAMGDNRVLPILAKQKSADPSDRGVQMATAAEAASPSLEIKRKWFAELTGSDSKKLALLRTAMRSAFPPWQDSIKESFATEYFDSLPKLAKEKQIDRASLFARSFLPATCTPKSAAAIGTFLSTQKDLPPMIKKDLRIAEQEDNRCVAVRQAVLKKQGP